MRVSNNFKVVPIDYYKSRSQHKLRNQHEQEEFIITNKPLDANRYGRAIHVFYTKAYAQDLVHRRIELLRQTTSLQSNVREL